MTDSVPEKLGKYRIIEEVGRGGFAAVYKAVDTTLDRTVALKCLASHLLWDPTFVQRFQREAKVAANLDHPNIVTIHEVSQIEGVYFIAMQFLEGRTLSQILQAEGPLPISRVRAIIEQMASALDYAHARGFVHRDIKPSNIIVAGDGRATLTDFGLVKAGEGTQLTASGVVFGTPEYMSPEQAEGEALDARSDIYSLGVVLYEMLAGRAPFVADTTPAVMYKHVHEPPPLDQLPTGLPQGVVAVVEKALAKKREDRYQSAGEMAAALQQAVSGAVIEKAKAPLPVAAPPSEPVAVAKEEPKPPTPKAAKKALGRGVLFVGGLVLLAIAGIVIFAISRGPSPSAPPGMVYVPADEFIMGSSDAEVDYALQLCNERYGNCQRDWLSGEQPTHTVDLDAFYIDETEVTNAQYQACVEAGECDTPRETTYYDDHNYARHPVGYVVWDQADKYCKWAGKRLPTEAEWEKAARGPERRVFPWGDEFDGTKLNYCDANCEEDKKDRWASDGYAKSAPVGSYPAGASPCGVLDMAGNVWEWTADWYEAYPDSSFQSPDYGRKCRVLRGGSWGDAPHLARGSNRSGWPPYHQSDNVGFRCAMDAE